MGAHNAPMVPPNAQMTNFQGIPSKTLTKCVFTGVCLQTGVLPRKSVVWLGIGGLAGICGWDLGFGSWDLGFVAGIWDLGAGIWDLWLGWDLWLAWVSDSDFGSAWPYTDLVSAG